MEPIKNDKDLSREPVNILFNPALINKKDVWDIDLVQILDLLTHILEKSGNTDMRVAGMATLTSALIYRLKVESIFALHRVSTAKEPIQRRNVNIELLDIPYRHESTHAVSLDELLGLLENLIGTMANPGRNGRKRMFDITEVPDIDKYMVALENVIGRYEDLIVNKITSTGTGILNNITSNLDSLDKIRCFLAILHLARDERVELEQVEEDIRITLIGSKDKTYNDSALIGSQ